VFLYYDADIHGVFEVAKPALAMEFGGLREMRGIEGYALFQVEFFSF
jgi:hypothetical protein